MGWNILTEDTGADPGFSHNLLSDLQGGDQVATIPELYHLTENQHDLLTTGGLADTLHIHDSNSILFDVGATLTNLIATDVESAILELELLISNVNTTVEWGDIAGDITNQTDLINYITNELANLSFSCSDILNDSTVDTGDTIQTVCDVLEYLDARIDGVSSGTDHNLLSSLQGGTSGEYYHLTASQHGILIGGSNADSLHIHDADNITFDAGSLSSLSATNVTDALLELESIIGSGSAPHNSLTGLQGGTAGEYYHLTSAQHSEITTFFANTDLTGAEAEQLSDGSNADSLHIHDSFSVTFDGGSLSSLVSLNVGDAILELEGLVDGISVTGDHNSLTGLQGGTAGEYYHLTQTQHDTLTDGSIADSLHVHDSNSIIFDVGATLTNLISTDVENAILELEFLIDNIPVSEGTTGNNYGEMYGNNGGSISLPNTGGATPSFPSDYAPWETASAGDLASVQFVAGGSGSPSVLRVLESGEYELNISISIQSNTVNSEIYMLPVVNSSGVTRLLHTRHYQTTSHSGNVSISGLLDLTENDEVSLYFACDNNGVVTITPVSISVLVHRVAPIVSVSWGDITGDITNQTDLVNYINNELANLSLDCSDILNTSNVDTGDTIQTVCDVLDYLNTKIDAIIVPEAGDFNHNDLGAIQGGNSTERYHLSLNEHTLLTTGVNADTLHFHDASVITFDGGSLTSLTSNNVEDAIVELEVLIGNVPHPDHNDLNALQGGTANEYYHLTLANHTFVTDLNAVVDPFADRVEFTGAILVSEFSGTPQDGMIRFNPDNTFSCFEGYCNGAWFDLIGGTGGGGTSIHNDLTGLQGGTTNEYYHFTSAEHTEITTFFAGTDLTGAEAETLSDGSNADLLHIHDSSAITFDAGSLTTLSATNVEEAVLELETLIGSLTLVHNDLTGLQGGTATERYHLSLTDSTFVTDLNSLVDANSDNLVVNGSVQLGTFTGTAQEGMLRYNPDNTFSCVEAYCNGAWVDLLGGSGGGGTDIHNNLTGLQGGTTNQYYHLTTAQHNEITTFFANTDLTGAEAETLSDGSNADSLHVHAHNSTTGLQGGTTNEYYHLTSAEHSEITTFFGATDITGAQAETLTDGSNADSLHTHAHNSTTGLQGGTAGEYYHLTLTQHTDLTTGINADDQHFHDSSNITFDGGSLTELESNNVEDALIELENKTFTAIIEAASVPLQFVFFSNTTDYKEVTSTSYEVIGNFIFKGTDFLNLEILKIIASKSAAGGTSSLRIYDLTNALEIAEISFTATAKQIYSTSTLNNLPTGEALFEIQALKDSGGGSGKTRINYVLME